MARIVVIGAGVGGLAAATRLQALGHDVIVCEQSDAVGGKLGTYSRDGYRFDTGPSLLTMPGVFADLEASIRDRFGIEEVIVAESVSDHEESILAAIGDAAAHFLESTIADNEVIGISSWSSSLLRMVDAITPIKPAAPAAGHRLRGSRR